MRRRALAVLGAGALWGLTGVFRRSLGQLGCDSAGVIVIRCGIAAILFGVTLLLRAPGQLRVRLRHLWCFFGCGVCSLLLFTFCYFQAMSLMSLSAAAILLYTAPAFVMTMSAMLFHERMTGRKLCALALAFAGCCLVSGVGGGGRLPLAGVLYGLGSGFGYALYSIFGKLAMQRGYGSLTINFYACLFAAAGAALVWGVQTPVRVIVSSWPGALWAVGTGLVTCYLPYLLYTWGRERLEPGRASIMASVEPVVATAAGIAVFHEALTVPAALGALAVLAAIAVLNLTPKRRKDEAENG